MTKFLAIQNSYHDIQIALFDPTSLTELGRIGVLDSLCASKIEASKMLAPLVGQLLTQNSLALSDLKFIAANRGPGPFTTLRTVLASVNGLAFATKLPLIGVDSLDAMLHESLPPFALSSERASRPEYRRVFLTSLSSTFIAHAVGSVIWIYADPATPEFWYALIPLVAVERLVMASGMTLAYYGITYSINFLRRHFYLPLPGKGFLLPFFCSPKIIAEKKGV